MVLPACSTAFPWRSNAPATSFSDAWIGDPAFAPACSTDRPWAATADSSRPAAPFRAQRTPNTSTPLDTITPAVNTAAATTMFPRIGPPSSLGTESSANVLGRYPLRGPISHGQNAPTSGLRQRHRRLSATLFATDFCLLRH